MTVQTLQGYTGPFQPLTVPGLAVDEQATLNRLLAQLDGKQRRNILRASYYDGKRAIRQVGSVIPPQYYRLGIVLGWSAKAVDILARRCNWEQVFWPDGDIDALGMRELADGNRLRSRLNAGIGASLQHGPAFLITTRGDASVGEPAALIHVKDALNATGDWNGRRQHLDSLLSITSRGENGRPTGLALYLPNLTVIAEFDASGWQIDRQPHPWGVPVEVLAYKPDERRPLGRSRISRAVMSLHDQALRAVIRMEGHMDVYSFPEMWLLGADEGIFKNADGTPKAAWQVMLGRIKAIPDDEDATTPRADVKQFSGSSPDPHLAHLNALAKMFARETSLPDTSVAITDVSNPTSEGSYDASQHELIAEAEGATDDWTLPIARTTALALAIQNGLTEVPAEWRSMDVKWRSARFLSRAAEADAGAKIVPLIREAQSEVELELLGLSEQQIRRVMADKRRASGSGALRALTEAAAARADVRPAG